MLLLPPHCPPRLISTGTLFAKLLSRRKSQVSHTQLFENSSSLFVATHLSFVLIPWRDSTYLPSAATTMDRCPLELWARIATFACTDGGYTGCSLSLVSHTMHDVVETTRYYSVSVRGAEKLFAFAARLATIGKTPVVRHLFIGDIRVDFPRLPKRGEGYQPGTWDRLRSKAEEDRAKVDSAIREIVSTAAPHLLTLTIHDWGYDPILDLISFPLLRDATLTRVPRGKPPAETRTRFPMLRRLHILSPNRCVHGLLDGLTSFAPDLTHLRLSGVTRDTMLPRVLRVLFDISSPSSPPMSTVVQQMLATALRLSALRFVCVQPAIYDSSGDRCGNPSMVHREMLADLYNLTRGVEIGEGVRKFVLLPEQKQYSEDEARRDWLDAIEGGNGAWLGSSGNLAGCVTPSTRTKRPQDGYTSALQHADGSAPPTL